MPKPDENRWAIYLDIGGTSARYPTDELAFEEMFDHLLDAVYQIGSRVFPEEPDRLFIHQVGGDGLVIVSSTGRQEVDRPIALAIALMRVVLVGGFVARGGLSTGTYGDVMGYRPSSEHWVEDGHRRYRPGSGVMTILSTMGTALIHAHRREERPPRGARLAVDASMIERVPDGVVVTHRDEEAVVVDWVHTRTGILDAILARARISLPPPERLEQLLAKYVARYGPDPDWKEITLGLNGLPKDRRVTGGRTVALSRRRP
jgi:hypothetical protein